MNENQLKDVRVNIGQLIRVARVKQKLTQKEVADYVGTTLPTLIKIEKGVAPYSIELLIKLTNLLKIEVTFTLKEL